VCNYGLIIFPKALSIMPLLPSGFEPKINQNGINLSGGGLPRSEQIFENTE
jgi:hypothetical protein